MSLHINFEPHSYYKGFAIEDYRAQASGVDGNWSAVTDNGNTYRVDMLEANTLKELKQLITEYREREAERSRQLYASVKEQE